MIKLKLSVLFLLIVLVFSASSFGNAFAQEIITIKTSADDHNGRFFGEGVLQVIVDDPDADNDSIVETIEVKIQADPDEGSGGSIDIIVPETSNSSGRFEFFLIHALADEVSLGDLDPINSAGIEGDGMCVADCAPLVTFGPGGDLILNSGLYKKVRFEIFSGNTRVDVNYEETAGTIGLDRSSYGTTSFVYISVTDQDANLNPRDRDQFMVDPDVSPNNDLLELEGGTLEDVVIFTETADNTGVFEGKYKLSTSILANTESLVLTLHEKANYDDTLDAAENSSNNIDRVSFTIGNSDGSINVGNGPQTSPSWDPIIDADKHLYLPGETVHVTVTDPDANVNTRLADHVQLVVSSGKKSIEVQALETGTSTGIFEGSFALGEDVAGSNSIVPSGSAEIRYTDKRPADYSEKVKVGENPEKDFTLEVDIQLPVKTGIESTNATAPEARDISGGMGPYEAGDSVILSTMISNNNEQEQPFIAIIEVRNSEGVTAYLALQGGMLESNGSTEVGVLWQPESSGVFEVRTFVMINIGGEAQLLSSVATSTMTII